MPLDNLWHAFLCHFLIIFTSHLFPSFLNNKEGIRSISNDKGEPVFEGVAAVVAVADPVLVDVFHSEGGRVPEMLPIGGPLDGAVAWRLHDGECDRLSLSGRFKKKKQEEKGSSKEKPDARVMANR